MVTVTGNLKDMFGANVAGAQVVFQLCNFGSALPRVAGSNLMTRTGQIEVDTDASGNFSTTVQGNDTITPAGTYYSVTIKDDNGDVVQTAAYQFTGGGSVALSSLSPFNPD